MITNQPTFIQLDQLLRRCFAMILGLLLTVVGFSQSDTILVCPQSDFFILDSIPGYNYISPGDTDFLIDNIESQTQIYYYLNASWASLAGDSIWKVAGNFGTGGEMFVQMANADSCDVAALTIPAFDIDFDCDSADISFVATSPDLLIQWDQARLLAHPTISTYQDLSTFDDSLTADYVGIIPEAYAVAGAVFCVQWSKLINGAQLNFLSDLDSILVPEHGLMGDTLYACRSSADSIADFNLFQLDYLSQAYASVTLFDTLDFSANPILPDSGFSSMFNDSLFVLLEYVNLSCPNDTVIVDLLINEYPELLVLGNTEMCAGDTLPIDVVNGLLPWVLSYNSETIFTDDSSLVFAPIADLDTVTVVTIIDALGCTNEVVLNDTLFLFPVPTIVLLEDTICAANQIEVLISGGPLTVFTSDSDSLNFDDIAIDSVITQIISTAPSVGGIITITEMTNAYCSNTQEFSFLVDDLPQYTQLDSLICGSDNSAIINTGLLNDLIDLDSDATSSWSYSDDTPVIQDSLFSASIDIYLELLNVSGCFNYDSLTVYPLQSAVVQLWDDTLYSCIGDTIDLAMLVPSLEVNYFDDAATQWEVHDASGALVPSIQVYFDPLIGLSIDNGDWESPLLLNVWTALAHTGCEVARDSAYFSISPTPEYVLIAGACAGENMFLEFESLAHTDSIYYTWAGEETVGILAGSAIPTVASEVGPTAELSLVLTSDQGCTLPSQELVEIFPIPVISSLTIGNSSALVLCENDVNIPIQAFPSDYSAYIWDVTGNTITSTDQNQDAEYLISVAENADSELLSLIAYDSLLFMNTVFSCVSETYEFPLNVSGTRCVISEIYQFPGGLFVLEVENTIPDSLKFVEWTVAGQDSILAGAFVYLPGTLSNPDAQLTVETSLYGPSICTCKKSIDTFGIVSDEGGAMRSFPNPVYGTEVQILLPSVFMEKTSEFRLLNANAEIVFSTKRVVSQPLIQLQIPAELRGVFILEVLSNDFSTRSKLIIE